MFSNLMIGFLAGLGFGGWMYSKLYRSTGGNAKNAIIAAAGLGLVAMFLVATILSFIFKS